MENCLDVETPILYNTIESEFTDKALNIKEICENKDDSGDDDNSDLLARVLETSQKWQVNYSKKLSICSPRGNKALDVFISSIAK